MARGFPWVCADFGTFGGRLNWGEKCVALNIPAPRCRIVVLQTGAAFYFWKCTSLHRIVVIWDQVVPNYNYDTVYQALQRFLLPLFIDSQQIKAQAESITAKVRFLWILVTTNWRTLLATMTRIKAAITGSGSPTITAKATSLAAPCRVMDWTELRPWHLDILSQSQPTLHCTLCTVQCAIGW